MRKLLLLAFCALLAAGPAEARTLYVNAKRPNNNGNGLKLSTAKKTIQAAINIAKKGDTILVYPGNYAPIKTNNKKITVKSVKGAKKTIIVPTTKVQKGFLAKLGKVWTESYVRDGKTYSYSFDPYTKGTATTMKGFLLDGKRQRGVWLGISGGKSTSCIVQHLDGDTSVAANAKLTACVLKKNFCVSTYGHAPLQDCTLIRCKIMNNTNCYYYYSGETSIVRCTLANCRVANNENDGAGRFSDSSVFVNCTIVANAERFPWETSVFTKSKFYNCILRNNTSQQDGGSPIIHNVDTGNSYSRTYKDNRDPKFVNEKKGDYKLKKGSPCIDKGKVSVAIKSLVGTKDLAGAKRIRGKAVDMGCYEY